MARKKKAADPAQETIPSILEQLSASGPGGGEPAKATVDEASLLSQIAALTERVERSERTNAALMAQPAPYEHPAYTPPPQAAAPAELPDPITHPREYADAVERNVLEKIGRQQYKQQSEESAARHQAERTDNLWGMFKDKYPELSEDQVLATAAATKVMNDLQKKKGLSAAALERYVYGTPELFIEDVATKLKTDYGVFFEDSDDAPTSATRTAVLGGADPLTRPSPDAAAKAQPTFVKDLRDLQRKDGYL